MSNISSSELKEGSQRAMRSAEEVAGSLLIEYGNNKKVTGRTRGNEKQ